MKNGDRTGHQEISLRYCPDLIVVVNKNFWVFFGIFVFFTAKTRREIQILTQFSFLIYPNHGSSLPVFFSNLTVALMEFDFQLAHIWLKLEFWKQNNTFFSVNIISKECISKLGVSLFIIYLCKERIYTRYIFHWASPRNSEEIATKLRSWIWFFLRELWTASNSFPLSFRRLSATSRTFFEVFIDI